MSKTMSIFLDALRFVSAMVVVFAHLTQPMFTSLGPDHTVYALAAVGVFFVLSGFVISYVVAKKEGTVLDYASARIARIYSVLVPAIVLSTIVLVIALKLDPAFLLHWVGPDSLHPLLNRHAGIFTVERSIFPLTFLTSFRESWRDMYPPLDSPIWSLGYEVGYYILFGVAVFSKGIVRVVLLLFVAYLLGPDLLRLLPVWLSGVLLYKTTASMRLSPSRSKVLGVLCFAGVVVACVFWRDYAGWARQHHQAALELMLRGRMRAYFAWVFYYWCVAACLLILGVAQFEKAIGRVLDPIERPIRWCANHTFSLYLFHFPLYILLYVTTHYNRSSFRSAAVIFLSDVLLCMLLSKVSEERKGWWRRIVTRTLERVAASIGLRPDGVDTARRVPRQSIS